MLYLPERPRIATGRAPVRIDFFGGWTDLPLFTELVTGKVLNTSITLYTYATVSQLPKVISMGSEYGYRVKRTDDRAGVCMYSEDLDIFDAAESIADIEYDGTLDLVKAACKRMDVDVEPGIQITTRTEAPPGSGLGTSASLGVAVVGALARYFNRPPIGFNDIADFAYRLEAEELGLLTGTQDQYVAAFGGMTLWKCIGEHVSYNPVRYGIGLMAELETRCVLAYTGKSRLSSDVHRHVQAAFRAGEINEPIRVLASLPEQALSMLNNGDLDGFGSLLFRNWQCQKQLHSSVTNSDIDSYFEIAYANGAIGGKACGAGGGGCLLFFAKRGKGYTLRNALKKAGLEILRFQIDTKGLDTWVWT